MKQIVERAYKMFNILQTLAAELIRCLQLSVKQSI